MALNLKDWRARATRATCEPGTSRFRFRTRAINELDAAPAGRTGE